MTDTVETNSYSNQRSVGERQLLIKNIFVEHDRFQDAYKAISRCHYPVIGGNPDTGCISVLAGESRVGKTYVASQYAKSFPSLVNDGGMTFPVLRVDIPIDGKRGLLEAIADALHLKHSLRVNSPSLLGMILRALVDHKVELLIFDEVQTMLNADSRQMVSYARHLFRKISNLGTLNVLCIGLEETYDFMSADPQLAGRGLSYTIVRPYSWDSEEERQLFRLLCDAFDSLLPFNQRSKLGTTGMAQRLYYASQGNIGRLKNFIFAAGCIAINDAADSIEVSHFAMAYDYSKPRDVNFNPFIHDMSTAPHEEPEKSREAKPVRDIFVKRSSKNAIA